MTIYVPPPTGGDDSGIIRQAIIDALTERADRRDLNAHVEFPEGHWRVYANRLLSNFDLTALGLTPSVRDGVLYTGQGRRASVIELVTQGQEKWFYDNQSISTQKFQKLDFQNLCLTTDDPEFGHGFKQWSQGGEKQFRFLSCDLKFGQVMHFKGTGNADLNRFLMCNVDAHQALFTFDNAQSVGNEVIGSNVHLLRHAVDVLEGGGGNTNFLGGCIEMYPHPQDTSAHYLVHSPVNAALGAGNAMTTFVGPRFEMHGVNKRLVLGAGTRGQMDVGFDWVTFGSLSGGPRVVVAITAGQRVSFRNSILNSDMLFEVDSVFAEDGNKPGGALLEFTDCDTGRGTPLHERVTITGDSARAVATGCMRQDSSVSYVYRVAEDFDRGWQSVAPRGPSAQAKIAAIKAATGAWPSSNTSPVMRHRVRLPAGAYVKRIVVNKPATGANSATYQLHVGTPGGVIHGSSTLAAFGDAHSIILEDVGTLPDDTVELWSTGAANLPAVTAGTAYVEYV